MAERCIFSNNRPSWLDVLLRTHQLGRAEAGIEPPILRLKDGPANHRFQSYQDPENEQMCFLKTTLYLCSVLLSPKHPPPPIAHPSLVFFFFWASAAASRSNKMFHNHKCKRKMSLSLSFPMARLQMSGGRACPWNVNKNRKHHFNFWNGSPWEDRVCVCLYVCVCVCVSKSFRL